MFPHSRDPSLLQIFRWVVVFCTVENEMNAVLDWAIDATVHHIPALLFGRSKSVYQISYYRFDFYRVRYHQLNKGSENGIDEKLKQ